MPVRAAKRLVNVEYRLREILARRHAIERLQRISERRPVHRRRPRALHVNSEDLRRRQEFGDLRPRPRRTPVRQSQIDPPVQRLLPRHLDLRGEAPGAVQANAANPKAILKCMPFRPMVRRKHKTSVHCRDAESQRKHMANPILSSRRRNVGDANQEDVGSSPTCSATTSR